MKELFKYIREIDRDHNGFVTQTELDDILKILFKQELENVTLKPIFLPFTSLANKVLVDYKKFRDYIVRELEDSKAKKSPLAFRYSPEDLKGMHSRGLESQKLMTRNNG